MPPMKMRLPGIEPGSSAWEAPMITITLQAPLETAAAPAHRIKKFTAGPGKRQRDIPDGTRTHNLRLRKPTPCPFGHWDRRVDTTSSGTRTHNLTLRRGAPYPLGHGGMLKHFTCSAENSFCFRGTKKVACLEWGSNPRGQMPSRS